MGIDCHQDPSVKVIAGVRMGISAASNNPAHPHPVIIQSRDLENVVHGVKSADMRVRCT